MPVLAGRVQASLVSAALKKTINQTLATKMNRRQFLVQAGAALLAVIGVGAIIQTLTQSTTARGSGAQRPSGATRSGSGAYGKSTYGR